MSGSSNLLAADALVKIIASNLRDKSSPQIKTSYDAVAVATHAVMIAVGFRLIGLGEDDKIDVQADAAQSPSLPEEWRASSPNYAFRYAHDQSSMEYLLKINRMGNKAVVMGMGLGHDKTTSFDIVVADYISPSSLPADPVPSSSSPDTPDTSSTDQTSKAILDVFISPGRLADLGALMRLNIIQKLIPGLQKEGYEDTTAESSTSSNSASRADDASSRQPHRDDYHTPTPARPHPLHDPLAQPRRPFPAGEFAPPGFEDPYDMTRPPRPMAGTPNFGNIGERDLYPQGLGPRDGIWGGLGPGLGGGMGAGGMHPTFDDPLFAGGRGGNTGYDPRAPPGSRFDPVNPGGAPRGNGDQPGFPGAGAGGQPHNPFGGFGSGDFI